MLFSIIIPTRNRAYTAIECIHSALSINTEDIEVLVHDCSENDDLVVLTNGINDARLRHVKVKPCSMTENWNQAASLAQGEYVMFLGDDDGLHPDTIDVVRWAKLSGIEAIVHAHVAHYWWPGFPDKHVESRLRVHGFTGKSSFYNAKVEFEKSTHVATISNFCFLPNIYQAIIRRDFLETLRINCGRYFFTTIVDAYAAFALSAYVKGVCFIDFPLTISGMSPSSNSARISRHVRNIDQHFREYESFPEKNFISPPTTGIIILQMAEALYQALVNTHRKQYLRNINIPRLYAIALVSRQSFREHLDIVRYYLHIAKNGAIVSLFVLFGYFLFEIVNRLYYYISTLIRKRSEFASEVVLGGIPGIQSAMEALQNEIRRRGIELQLSDVGGDIP
jgi:Glycosyltransferases involved in cell wall biogenesis